MKISDFAFFAFVCLLQGKPVKCYCLQFISGEMAIRAEMNRESFRGYEEQHLLRLHHHRHPLRRLHLQQLLMTVAAALASGKLDFPAFIPCVIPFYVLRLKICPLFFHP